MGSCPPVGTLRSIRAPARSVAACRMPRRTSTGCWLAGRHVHRLVAGVDGDPGRKPANGDNEARCRSESEELVVGVDPGSTRASDSATISTRPRRTPAMTLHRGNENGPSLLGRGGCAERLRGDLLGVAQALEDLSYRRFRIGRSTRRVLPRHALGARRGSWSRRAGHRQQRLAQLLEVVVDDLFGALFAHRYPFSLQQLVDGVSKALPLHDERVECSADRRRSTGSNGVAGPGKTHARWSRRNPPVGAVPAADRWSLRWSPSLQSPTGFARCRSRSGPRREGGRGHRTRSPPGASGSAVSLGRIPCITMYLV